MKTISKALALAAATLSFTTPARAEQAAAFWSGAYFGIGASYSQLDTAQYSQAQMGAPGYDVPGYGGGHSYGFVQAGYRQQSGALVSGLRLRHQKTGSAGDQYLKVDELVSSNAVSVTTLSGTLGYLVRPSMLVYATAGAAYGRFNYGSVDERWGLVDDSLNASRKGLSVGFGAEVQLSDQLSVFAEYSHTRIEKGTSTFDYGSGLSWTYDFRHRFDEVQLGMNILF